MNRKQKRALIFLGVTLLEVAVIYFGVAAFYRNRFVLNTTIAGVSVDNMTYESASDLFSVLADDYKVKLKFREDKEETLKGPDFDFEYHVKDDIKHALDEQNSLHWPAIMVKGEHYHMDISFNKKKLKKLVKALPECKKKNMVQPVDAYAAYKKGQYVIVPEVMGTKLKAKDVSKLVGERVLLGDSSVDLEDVYINPDIYKEDKGMAEEIDKLQENYGLKITYKLPGKKKKVLCGKQFLKWLVRNEDGEYVRDEARWNQMAIEYVAKLAEKVDTVNKDHKFKTNQGEVITLPGLGYYGYKINQEEEVAQINADVEGKKDVKREPVYKRREAAEPDDNYGYGDTYVEVNLSDQTLWIYKKGKMVFSTPVVSGLNTPKRRTPAGAFYIYDMDTDRELVGQGYRSAVDYWMRLTEMGVGIHDAKWRGSFGGSIWTYDGSHGCINVPHSAARTIYNTVETYMPVAVYY